MWAAWSLRETMTWFCQAKIAGLHVRIDALGADIERLVALQLGAADTRDDPVEDRA